MRRRSILKSTALTIISVATVQSFIHRDSASAAGNDPKAQTQGGALQKFDKDDKPNGECPLKHTEVKAQLSGFLSRVTVRQDFENNFPEKIEAVYTFPLPQSAAVDDLTMLIGDRTIKGKIMRREEAQSAYAAAKQIGEVASLLDQERPNIFTQQVATILPGQRIRIIISYIETLKYEDGAYEWSFPMVVAERYVPAAVEEQEPNQVTDVSRISPPSAPGVRAGHDISLEIDLDVGMPIVGVNSDSHETEVQQINEQRAVVRLKDRATIPNKDFPLTYRVAGSAINDAVLTHRSEGVASSLSSYSHPSASPPKMSCRRNWYLWQQQFYVSGSSSIVRDDHLFKFGGEYRQLSPRIDLRTLKIRSATIAGNQTLAFGQSTAIREHSLSSGGFPSFYSFGGARTLRFSGKLEF